ncbi:MAG: M15 family metallopeptidase, partial [Shewanella sp.]
MLTPSIAAASEQLYGLSELTLVSYLCPYHPTACTFLLEPETAKAFTAMAARAAEDGIHLAICSAHRSFARQLAIWNAKASGQRLVLDANEQPVAISGLSDDALIDLILLWSALPGASRHHWGTDLDVFDAKNIAPKDLRLVAAEYQPPGPCAKLHAWLLAHGENFGFYFPFQTEPLQTELLPTQPLKTEHGLTPLSGVRPEPWHISYFLVSQTLLPQFDKQQLATLIANSDMLLKEAVLAR